MGEKIDVLMLANISARPGGVYRHMCNTAKALGKEDFVCNLVFNSGVEDRIPPQIMKYLAPYSITLKVLIRFLSGKKIFAVEIHEPSAYFYCVLKKIFPFLPRCFVRSHGIEERRFEIESAYYYFPLKTRFLQKIRNRLNRLGLALSDLNIVNNSADRKFVEKICGKEKTITSRALVSEEIFKMVNPKKHSGVNVVFIGGWLRVKGSHRIKEIIPRVLAGNKSINFYLLGIGANSEMEVKRCFRSFEGRVKIVPIFKEYSELPRYLNKADIMLCPSTYESGPIAVLEGMAFKLAIVCSKNCFLITDIASDGKEVVFVEAADIDGYVNAVLDLAKNEKKRKAIAESGFKLVKERYPREVVKEYLQYLKAQT